MWFHSDCHDRALRAVDLDFERDNAVGGSGDM